MRYRQLVNGDMSWGSGNANFLINSPGAVVQAILTRLALWQGQWFLDQTAGVPYPTQILGKGTARTYDQAIRQVILGTEGVLTVESYASQVVGRGLSVQATVTTIYDGQNGGVPVQILLPRRPPTRRVFVLGGSVLGAGDYLGGSDEIDDGLVPDDSGGGVLDFSDPDNSDLIPGL